MPQIAQIGEIFASQLFWLAIFFGAIFVVIGLGMLPKIQSTVDARDAKIAADLEAARGAREAADSLEEGYRAEMDKSRAEAARLAAEAKAKRRQGDRATVAKADKAIGGRIDAAMTRDRRGTRRRAGRNRKCRRRGRRANGRAACRASASMPPRRAPRLRRNWSMAEPDVATETHRRSEVPAPSTARRAAAFGIDATVRVALAMVVVLVILVVEEGAGGDRQEPRHQDRRDPRPARRGRGAAPRRRGAQGRI